MKKPLVSSSSKLAFAISLIPVMLLCLAVAPLHAAVFQWSGGGADGKWLTGANWTNGTAPSANDSLIFTGAAQVNNTNNLSSGTTVGGITFNNPAGPFVLWGNSLTLGGDIADNQASTLETINLALTLNATRNINVTDNGLLTLNGIVSGSGNGITKGGNGTLTLNANNTFSGALTVNAGTVAIFSDSNLGTAPGVATAGKIVMSGGGGLATTNSFTINKNRGISLGTGSGAISVIGDATAVTYGGNMAGSGGGGLNKLGFGSLTLFGTNTYSGTTSNEVGTLILDFSQTGAPVSNIISSSSKLVLGGANSGIAATNFAQLTMTNGSSASSQTFSSTHGTFAAANIVLNNGAGSLTLNLGALDHDPGGTLMLQPPTSGSIKTTTTNLNGILGAWALMGGQLQNGVLQGTNFAAVDGSGNVIQFNNYFVYSSPGQGTLHSLIDANTTGVETNLYVSNNAPVIAIVDNNGAATTTDINAVRIDPNAGTSSSSSGIIIGTNNTLRLGRFGGFLSVENVNTTPVIGGATNVGSFAAAAPAGSQNVGTLTAGGPTLNTPGEIVITHVNISESAGGFSIPAKISDNGSGVVTVVKNGAGSIKLGGHNTFSGGLYLLNGRVQFTGNEGSVGTVNPDAAGTGPIFILPGCYLFPSGGSTVAGPITNAIFVAGFGDGGENFGEVRGGNYSGPVTMIGDTCVGADTPNFFGSYGISGSFNLTVGAPARNSTVSFGSSGDSWTGNTTLSSPQNGRANVLISSNNEVIPNGFGKGNVTFFVSGTGTFRWDLTGFSETINGLSSIGASAVGGNCLLTNNKPATASTLIVGDNDQSGTFGGLIAGNIALVKIGAGIETLTATNPYTGNTTVSNGVLALSGAGSIGSSGAITVLSNATLDISAATTPAFSTTHTLNLGGGTLAGNTAAAGISTFNATNGAVTVIVDPSTTNIYATTLTTGGVTNMINITAVQNITAYPSSFVIIKYTGSLGGVGNNFGIGTVPSSNTGGFVTNDTSIPAIVLVLTNGPRPLTWTGTDSTNPQFWDVATTTNWLAFGSIPAPFNNADSVLFNDSGTTTNVNVTTSLNPSAITVSNITKNYTFNGIGAIGGVGGLTKAGAGTLTMNDTGGDGFRGGIAVNAGTVILATDNGIGGGATIASGATLQVGTNGGTGNTPSGSIGMDGSLVINRGADLTIAGTISGTSSGSLTKSDTNVLLLSGFNSFTGTVSVASGTLKAGTGTALGVTNGSTTISSGATLDINGNGLTGEPVTVGGSGVGSAGAIVNNSTTTVTNALQNVTLTANTVFGGVGRWDIRESSSGQGNGNLTGAFNLTKIGSNQVTLAGVNVDASLGDITNKQGTFAIEGGTASLGNSANSLIVSNGATFQVSNLGSTEIDKNFILNGDGVATTLSTTAGVQNKLGGSMTFSGNCIVNASASSLLTVACGISGTANVVQIGSGTNIYNGILSYVGTTAISNGVMIVDGSKNSGTGITVAVGGALGGSSSLNGENVIANGRLIPGDQGNLTGSLDLGGGNLTLNSNTNLFSLKQGSLNSRVTGINTLTVNGTSNNVIQLAVTGGAPLLVGDAFPLFTYTSTTATVNNFLVLPLSGYSFYITNDTSIPAIVLVVTKAVKSLVWDGNPSGVWDTNTTTADWTWPDSANAHTNFSNGDFVTFNGLGNVRTVNVSTVVAPAQDQVITFDDSNPYTLVGSGSITGATGIFMRNGLNLTVANSNAISGPTVIDFGTLTLGGGGSSGSLGTGPIMATNTSEVGLQFLVFNRSDSGLIITNVISGLMAVTNVGSGTVTLGGANTFTGGVTVASGTLRAWNNTALGNTNIAVVVSNSATLDITNGVGVSSPIIVSGSGVGGNGAIVNNSGSTAFTAGQGVMKVTMTGDTTVGGSGRLDFRSNPVDATTNTSNFFLSTGGNSYNLTKVGTNQFQLAGISIDPALSNVTIMAGTFGVQTLTNFGDPAGTVTVSNGATFTFFDQSNAITKPTVLLNGAIVGSTSGSNIWNGNITMNGSNTFNITAVSFNPLGTIGGSPTAITKSGGSTLMLHGNSLPAPSSVWDLAAGTLDLTAASSSTLTLTGSQQLRGNGGVNGGISLGASTTLSPGEPSTNFLSLGTITASNSLSSTGLVFLELNLTNSSTVSNDMVAASSITLSGTVTVSNIGPALVTGDKFQLFSVAPTGSYTLSPLPPLAGGLSWSNRLAIDGSILVTGSAGPTTNAPILSVRLDNGTNVVIHGTNNNIPNTSFEYVVLTSTNITLPLSNWTSIATNGFNGSGQYDFTNPIAPGKPVLFYDTKAVP